MPAFMREMWRLVRPGGVLAVTTWGPGLFEPANSHFWRCVGHVEPSLVKAFSPWDQITTPAALAGLFSSADIPDPAVEAADGQHHLEHPDDFWEIVLGSGVPGYRQRPQPRPRRPAPRRPARRTARARDHHRANRRHLRDGHPPCPCPPIRQLRSSD
jgi:SAM-dependent methyltransferase